MNNQNSIFLVFISLILLAGIAFKTNDHATLSVPNESEGIIYFIRHADREPDQDRLSEVGKKQALKLKAIMQKHSIDFIYSTDYNRTKSTIIPLSMAIGIPYETYDPRHQEILRIKLLTHTSQKKNVLVVGHANTLPELIHLCNPTMPEIWIRDNEFDKIYSLYTHPRKTFKTQTYAEFESSVTDH